MEKNVMEVKVSFTSDSVEKLNDLNDWINKQTERINQVLSEKNFITDTVTGRLNAYETDLVVKELLCILTSKEITIEEAERVLDQAKSELKHARLIGDGQSTSAQL